MPNHPESKKEHTEQLDELTELISRILSIGRALNVSLAAVSDTREEKAAWSALGIIELSIQEDVYTSHTEQLSLDLETAQENLAIVFPRIEFILDSLNLQASALRQYAGSVQDLR